jgi:tRNA-specific 2-thiouridylase
MIMKDHKSVIVGLSGGVDSTIAAVLLQQAGFDVRGVTLHLWHVAPEKTTSIAERARAITDALGIPLQVLNVRERFYDEVVLPFADTYARGETPNPCVVCNPSLKFDALLTEADRVGATWIATGHYARVTHPSEGPAQLLRARSRQRDQSYMLHRLNQRILTRLRLPLGELEDKAAVRELAHQLDLPSADVHDSQDLCFLAGGDYRAFLREMRPQSFEAGPIVDENGNVLGQHLGLPRYTVGQRSGLGLAKKGKLYVLALRPADNALVVGPAERLQKSDCRLRDVTFTRDGPPAPRFHAEVRIRYRAPLVSAEIELLSNASAHVTFSQPQRAPAPGQSVVFYRGDVVLGGGIIH